MPDKPTRAMLRVRVQPRARRNEVRKYAEGTWYIAVTAPPAEGQANEAVRRLLAGVIGVAARDVTIASGASSRTKVVAIDGITAEEMDARLRRAAQPSDS